MISLHELSTLQVISVIVAYFLYSISSFLSLCFFIRISHQYFHINLVITSREFTHHKFCTTTLNWASRWRFQSSFAQWHYHSLWRSTEAWWLLIENFSQYPARRREIPTAMQCLKDPSGSISTKKTTHVIWATRIVNSAALIRPENTVEIKTVLFRIISIVRVPSLCFNKDTHDNFDDEVECFSLSVKLESIVSAKIRSPLWWTFHLLISSRLEERSTNWEVSVYLIKTRINTHHKVEGRYCRWCRSWPQVRTRPRTSKFWKKENDDENENIV